jgi:protein-tyrosine kinase
MERIRKALDLARLERSNGGVAARLESIVSTEPVTSVEPITSVEPVVREEPPESRILPAGAIVYSITKSFSPNSQHLERHRVMAPGAAGEAPGAYRLLRTQVLQRMDSRKWRSLAIFSPGPRDGKTTTAINLAISLAGGHLHTVLLVEFDFKRPTLAKTFGLEPQFGVDDVLSGDADLADCLYHPEGFERLVLLPARSTLANSSEILAGPRGRELVAELRGRYDDRVVIFDLPPVLNADDALAFAPFVEAGLVVASEGRTRRDDLVRTIELLSATPLVGTVLNRAVDTPSGY